MIKDDIQIGSIVYKTAPGSKNKPLKVVALNETHAKVYYLSSAYQDQYAKWYPKKDLALWMVPVPEKKIKHFLIKINKDVEVGVSSTELSVGDFVVVSMNEGFVLGQVNYQVLEPTIMACNYKIYKIAGMTEIEHE